MSTPDKPPRGSDYAGLALMTTAVGEIVVPIAIGAWLDDRNGWSPWGAITGAVLGLVGAVFHLTVIARRADRRPPG